MTTTACDQCGQTLDPRAKGTRCLQCRRAASPKRSCPECGAEMDQRSTLCIQCRSAHWAREQTCPECGGPKQSEAKICISCHRGKLQEKRELAEANGKDPSFALHHGERGQYGVTVTCERIDEPDTRTIVGAGTAADAMLEVCAQIDKWEGEWKVSCVSSPVTIHRDLYASRVLVGTDRNQSGSGTTPEATYLTRIGRLDLLAERTLTVNREYAGPHGYIDARARRRVDS